MSEINIAQAIQERQNKFIENRTIIETQVNNFLASLRRCSPDVISTFPGIFTAEGASARTLLPELWNEPFNEEVYKAQLEIFKQNEDVVRDIRDKMNAEALQCLQS